MNIIIYDYSHSTATCMPSNTEAAAPTDTLSRVQRKRKNARARILSAAEQLMREGPVDAVTIAQITDAADVGHGTFYLHFKSKYEVLVPIIGRYAALWDGRVQQSLAGETDPARVLATSARLMARITLEDPLWRWFLAHSGVPVEDMRSAVGAFSTRDFQRGIDSGRFDVPNNQVMRHFVLGAYVNTLLASLTLDHPGPDIDAMAELILRTAGLDHAEAAQIAHAPLPAVTPPEQQGDSQ